MRLDAIKRLAGNRDVACAVAIALDRYVAAGDLLLAINVLSAAATDDAQAGAGYGFLDIGRATTSNQCPCYRVDRARDDVNAIVNIERADVGLEKNEADAVRFAGFKIFDRINIG